MSHMARRPCGMSCTQRKLVASLMPSRGHLGPDTISTNQHVALEAPAVFQNGRHCFAAGLRVDTLRFHSTDLANSAHVPEYDVHMRRYSVDDLVSRYAGGWAMMAASNHVTQITSPSTSQSCARCAGLDTMLEQLQGSMPPRNQPRGSRCTGRPCPPAPLPFPPACVGE